MFEEKISKAISSTQGHGEIGKIFFICGLLLPFLETKKTCSSVYGHYVEKQCL